MITLSVHISRHTAVAAMLLLIGLLLAACASQEAASSDDSNLAAVDEVEVRPMESNPQEVEVWVSGLFANPCSKIGEVTEQRDGSTITLTLLTEPSNRAGCENDRVAEFIQIIPLDVAGLEAGTYTVVANGVRSHLTLADHVR